MQSRYFSTKSIDIIKIDVIQMIEIVEDYFSEVFEADLTASIVEDDSNNSLSFDIQLMGSFENIKDFNFKLRKTERNHDLLLCKEPFSIQLSADSCLNAVIQHYRPRKFDGSYYAVVERHSRDIFYVCFAYERQIFSEISIDAILKKHNQITFSSLKTTLSDIESCKLNESGNIEQIFFAAFKGRKQQKLELSSDEVIGYIKDGLYDAASDLIKDEFLELSFKFVAERNNILVGVFFNENVKIDLDEIVEVILIQHDLSGFRYVKDIGIIFFLTMDEYVDLMLCQLVNGNVERVDFQFRSDLSCDFLFHTI